MTASLPGRAWRPAFLIAAVLVVVYIVDVGRDGTFFYDEWTFLLTRQGHSASVLLDAYNGNCSLFTLALFKGLVSVFGTSHHWIFRVVLVALHIGVVLLVLALVRPRLGAFGAAVAAIAVLAMGTSAENMLWPAQYGYLLSSIGGLTALLVLDRVRAAGAERGSGTGLLVLACFALVLALGASANGAPLWLMVTVEIAAVGTLRRRAWWVVAIPLGLYVVWALAYGDNQIVPANLPLSPRFASTMAASAAGGLFGLSVDWGRPLALVGVAVLAAWWLRGGHGSPRIVGALLALGALFSLTGLARASYEDPAAPRYIYIGGILILLVAAEALREWSPRDGRPAFIATIVLVVVVALGIQGFHTRGDELRADATAIKARLGAVDLIGAGVPASFAVSPRQPQVIAGPVMDIERRHGRISDTPSALRAADEGDQTQADEVLLSLGALRIAAANARRATTRGCTSYAPGTVAQVQRRSGESIEVTSAAGAQVEAWRFADAPSLPPAVAPGGTTRVGLLRDGDDGSPWKLRLTSAAKMRVCTG